MPQILIVDDSEEFRHMLRNVLQTAGYDVQDAPNGKAALELYRQHPFDLVITDLIMPEKEGLETIVEFRRIHQAVKIIAISGGDRINAANNLAMAQKLGADRTLPKPFSPDEILNIVAQLLGGPKD